MSDLGRGSNTICTLANMFSFGALFFIWIAVVTLLESQFYISLGFAFTAFLFDTLDGWAARKYKTASDFGRLLDGQIDTLVHLFYPALVFYLYFGLTSPLSMSVLFIFLAAGIFRLVRFNLVGFVEKEGAAYYPGLPVFVNNFVILILILLNNILSGNLFKNISLVLIAAVSILMVQKFPFPKPKKVFPILVALVIIILFIFFVGLRRMR